MGYSHTQWSPLWLLLAGVGVVLAAGAGSYWGQGGVEFARGGGAAFFFLIAASFAWLRIEDGGEFLRVRYGPLPVFGTRVRYDTIESVEAGRSALIDGWGIHYVPGRGWTYNLWGRDCVVVRRGGRVVRLGTDDVEGLEGFLRERICAGG